MSDEQKDTLKEKVTDSIGGVQGEKEPEDKGDLEEMEKKVEQERAQQKQK